MTTHLKASFVTLFPEIIESCAAHSIIGRAIESGTLSIETENIRDYGIGKYKKVDDTPYGGGPGLIMRVDCVVEALRAVLSRENGQPEKRRIILTDPAGKSLKQEDAIRLSQYEHLVFVTGRYEGIDARIYNYVDEILSIGDFVVTGGELPAFMIFDATARCIPGVLGNADSLTQESYSSGLLEHSQYTRPKEFEGHAVPSVLQNGDHAQIEKARHDERISRTIACRPDLLEQSQDQAKITASQYPWAKFSILGAGDQIQRR